MEITIPKGTPQHRVFQIAMDIWDNFVEWYPKRKYEDGTNFCHFVRMIVVYAPIAVVTNLLMWAVGVATLVVLPIHFFGAAGYIMTVISLAVLAGVIIGVRKLVVMRREKKALAPKEYVHQSARSDIPKGPGFTALAGKYLAAKKAKICPPVVFTDSTEEVAHATSH